MAFFDELSKKISSTASKAGQMAGDTAEIAKLKVQISSEQEKIRKAYAELGKKYYEAHRSDMNAEFAELINVINTSFTVIQDANVSIQEHKSNITAPSPAPAPSMPLPPGSAQVCPNCRNQIPSGARFCTFCGNELTVQNTPVCTGCGAVLEPGTKFCTSCGTPVNKISTGIPTLSTPELTEPDTPVIPIDLPEPEFSFDEPAVPETDDPETH